jgi:hypothetical protein
VNALWMVRSSPLTNVVLLAHGAQTAVAVDGVPPAATLLVVALLAFPSYRRVRLQRASPAVAIVLLVSLLVSFGPPTSLAHAAEGVEPFFDGTVRAGRPVTVRAPGAQRVRAEGGPWALPMGTRGDEFVLLGATIVGETIRLEVDTGDGPHAAEIAVRPLPTDDRAVARLVPGDLAADEIRVRPLDLPTVRDAWLVFDGVSGIAAALPASQVAAVQAFADDGPRSFPFEPALLPAAPDIFRLTAVAQSRAPRLPSRTVRVLLVLAVLELVLLGLVARRGRGSRRDVLLATAVPLLAFVWLSSSSALPGSVRATSVVLEGDLESLVLVRLEASSDATVVVEPPAGAGLVVPAHWDASDAESSGISVGWHAEVTLKRGRLTVLVYRVARTRPVSDTELSSSSAWIEPLAAWLRPHDLVATELPTGGAEAQPRIDGVPVVVAGRASISSR